MEIAKEAGAGIISPAFRLVTPEQVRVAHATGLQVVPWTANKPKDWNRLIAAGVDAIITDDPAALIAYLKHREALSVPSRIPLADGPMRERLFSGLTMEMGRSAWAWRGSDSMPN